MPARPVLPAQSPPRHPCPEGSRAGGSEESLPAAAPARLDYLISPLRKKAKIPSLPVGRGSRDFLTFAGKVWPGRRRSDRKDDRTEKQTV